MRFADAAARCPSMIIMPSMRNGGWSISTYELNATIVPTVALPSITIRPPRSSTSARPNRGRLSSTGFHRLRIAASRM
ncbi:hypothetical protein JCM9534A_67620 [Catenuloplanes indicus JCM 9534]